MKITVSVIALHCLACNWGNETGVSNARVGHRWDLGGTWICACLAA